MRFITDFFPKQPGYFVFCLVIFLVSSESCKKKAARSQPSVESSTVNEASTVEDTLPADFVIFFDKFHADSQYQMDHIIFPLEGLPNSTGDTDTVITERYFWQRENWKRHNPFTDPSHQFENWFQMPDERIVEHYIRMKGTNLVIHRRFARLDDGWYLIYYAGMRPRNL